MVRWVVPRASARGLGFIVETPFRTALPMGAGYPAMVVTQFRGKRPGSPVTWRYARRSRSVSGCIGRLGGSFANTVVIRKVRVDGQPRASAYLQRSVRSRPYWTRVTKASRHLSEPTICG